MHDAAAPRQKKPSSVVVHRSTRLFTNHHPCIPHKRLPLGGLSRSNNLFFQEAQMLYVYLDYELCFFTFVTASSTHTSLHTYHTTRTPARLIASQPPALALSPPSLPPPRTRLCRRPLLTSQRGGHFSGKVQEERKRTAVSRRALLYVGA